MSSASYEDKGGASGPLGGSSDGVSTADWALRQDIAKALRSGTVPPAGLERLAVGLEPQVAAIEELLELAATGRSAYKFLQGGYGAGKTFLSTLAASRAVEKGFLSSSVVISRAETPLYRLEQVYRKICLELRTASHPRGALQSVLDRWLYRLEEQVIEIDGIDERDPRFYSAVAQRVDRLLGPLGERAGRMVACLRAYHRCQLEENYADGRALLDWLCGDPKVAASVKRLAGVTGTLDSTDAGIFLRGLLELVRASGHRGLLVVLDEVETISALRRPERQKSLEVLRTLVDALDKNEYPGLVLLVTGTPDLFEGHNGVPSLAPLHDRIKVVFSEDRPDNLRMPLIRLRPFDATRLRAVARKVKELYPATRPERIERRIDEALIGDMVDVFTQGFGGSIEVVPRLFLREFLQLLDLVDQHDYDPRRQYSFDPDRVAEVPLTDEERQHLQAQTRTLYL